VRIRGNRRERGFTLIELLVVVVIIGILAAVALPKLFSAICSSKIGAVNGVISGLNSAMTLYFGDNRGVTANSTGADLFAQAWFTPKYYNAPATAADEDPWGFARRYRYAGGGLTGDYTVCFAYNNGFGCGTVDGTHGLFSTQTGKISPATACP
jgi:general secretion pathway protein G